MDHKPLMCPPGFLETEQSPAERFWWRVPILGWQIAAILQKRRVAPFHEKLRTQLAVRDAPPDSAWGDDPEKLRLARLICDVVREQFDWPNEPQRT